MRGVLVMKQIELPMKVHAAKLEYRRRLLEELPHGHFRFRRKPTVVITFDPENPKFTGRNPRFLFVHTKLGQKYSELIHKYKRIKAEYDSLLKSWNETYCFAPPRVKLPLTNAYNPHKMNNEYFNNQKDYQGRYSAENPAVSDDGIFKSKNELIASDALKEMEIPFKYETKLYIAEANETINPDYLLDFYEIDRCSYLEVLGMNDKFSYAASTTVKISSYSIGKYRPGRDVIYIHLYDKYNFDKAYFIQMVWAAYDCLIPNDALEWGEDYKHLQLSSSDESCGYTTLKHKKASA